MRERETERKREKFSSSISKYISSSTSVQQGHAQCVIKFLQKLATYIQWSMQSPGSMQHTHTLNHAIVAAAMLRIVSHTFNHVIVAAAMLQDLAQFFTLATYRLLWLW